MFGAKYHRAKRDFTVAPASVHRHVASPGAGVADRVGDATDEIVIHAEVMITPSTEVSTETNKLSGDFQGQRWTRGQGSTEERRLYNRPIFADANPMRRDGRHQGRGLLLGLGA
jgi:hypothetical protein